MQHTDRQALEEKIAHLEHAVSELSDVIRRQDRDLAALTRRVEILAATEAERAREGGGGVVLGDERPPHW